jgi:methylmalonyl-CoA decarboxylase
VEQYQDCIGTLTLNNDAKRNFLNEALMDKLVYALARMKGQSARAVILRANPGTKVWSVRHDIRELPKPGHDPCSFCPIAAICAGARSA